MRFEEALQAMREGKKVKTKYTPVLLLEDDEIWFKCKHGTFNYFLTTGEVLAEDWEVIEDE